MGLTTLDVVQVVGRVPAANEKVVASDGWITFGGPAANAAGTVAALGGQVRLVTALGVGAAADLVRQYLYDAGVTVVDLTPDLEVLPVSTVLLDAGTGQRAVVSRNGAAAPDLTAAASTVVPAGSGDVVLADGHHLGAAVSLAGRSRAQGALVLLDGGSWKPGLGELLAMSDVAVLSGDFRLPETDVRDVLDRVAQWGPRVVAQSHGEGAVKVWDDGQRLELTPPTVPVVDTLGAGDVLHGAMAHALSTGQAPTPALEYAIQIATKSVQHPGPLTWSTP